MIRRIAARCRRRRSLPPVAGGHVRLHAEDRLDALFLAFVEKFDNAEHAPVIGDRDAVHPQRFDPLDQIRNPAAPSSSE